MVILPLVGHCFLSSFDLKAIFFLNKDGDNA